MSDNAECFDLLLNRYLESEFKVVIEKIEADIYKSEITKANDFDDGYVVGGSNAIKIIKDYIKEKNNG